MQVAKVHEKLRDKYCVNRVPIWVEVRFRVSLARLFVLLACLFFWLLFLVLFVAFACCLSIIASYFFLVRFCLSFSRSCCSIADRLILCAGHSQLANRQAGQAGHSLRISGHGRRAAAVEGVHKHGVTTRFLLFLLAFLCYCVSP